MTDITLPDLHVLDSIIKGQGGDPDKIVYADINATANLVAEQLVTANQKFKSPDGTQIGMRPSPKGLQFHEQNKQHLQPVAQNYAPPVADAVKSPSAAFGYDQATPAAAAPQAAYPEPSAPASYVPPLATAIGSPAPASAPATGGFSYDVGLPVPTRRFRFAGDGQTAAIKAAIEGLPVNASFHIPATAETPEPHKKYSSLVSQMTAKFGRLTGGKKTTRKGKEINAKTPVRVFSIRAVKPEDNDPRGPGARVFRGPDAV